MPVGETSVKQEKLKNGQNQRNAIFLFMTFQNHRQNLLCYFTSTSVVDSEYQITKDTISPTAVE